MVGLASLGTSNFPDTPNPVQDRDEMTNQIDELLAIACSKGASDLHVKAGSFPFMRVNGELIPII